MVFERETEYMDYTLLKKKGLLKIKEENMKKNLTSDGGFIDFTSMRNTPSSNNTSNNSSPANGFGFLSDMASSATQNQVNTNPLANFDSVLSGSPSTSASNLNENVDVKELNALKIKIEDIDYKMDKFIERIDKLEEKLARFG